MAVSTAKVIDAPTLIDVVETEVNFVRNDVDRLQISLRDAKEERVDLDTRMKRYREAISHLETVAVAVERKETTIRRMLDARRRVLSDLQAEIG